MKKQKQAEYRGYRTAGIRLKEESLPDMVTNASSSQELPQLYAYHAFDKAHLVMLAEQKIIPGNAAAQMLAALREMEAAGVEKTRLETGGGMHSGEVYLVRKLSEKIGGYIHVGRSSGDLNRVADRMRMRDQLLLVMEAVNNLRESLIKVAERYKNTVMPGYTHGQHAQPTTLGHQILSWVSVLERDFTRLLAAFAKVNVSPAGAAILTGSNFPVDRFRTAALLGFDKPAPNTMDAIHSTDDVLEVAAAIAILHESLARWADDIILWTGSEYGMMDIPDQFCTTSSLLPQKKNAYAMEHTRGAAAFSIGMLMNAFIGERGTTGLSVLARNYYSKPPMNQSFENVVRDLKWLAALMPEIRVNEKLMLERANAFWATASDVAGALVQQKGLPWRTAHQIVSILVRLSYERGIKPTEVDTSLLDEAAVEYLGKPIKLGQKALQKAIDPVVFVKSRTLFGGPAPAEVERRIVDYTSNLAKDRNDITKIRAQIEKAGIKLEKAIDKIIRQYPVGKDAGGEKS